MSNTDRWGAKAILQLIGWGCIVVALVLIFPAVGQGGGAGHEPGSKGIPAIIFESDVGIAVLLLASTGLVVLLASSLVRSRPPSRT